MLPNFTISCSQQKPASEEKHGRVMTQVAAQFEGGVVVISHDSQLLSRVCDDAERSEIWLVEDGRVRPKLDS